MTHTGRHKCAMQRHAAQGQCGRATGLVRCLSTRTPAALHIVDIEHRLDVSWAKCPALQSPVMHTRSCSTCHLCCPHLLQAARLYVLTEQDQPAHTWLSSTSTFRNTMFWYSGLSLRATKIGPIIWQGPHLRAVPQKVACMR
jgi:hypothetical protein